MKWLRDTGTFEMSCLLCNGGPLVAEYSALCATTVLSELPWRDRAIRRRVMAKAKLDGAGLWLHRREALRSQVRSPDVVYCNTIAALPALELAAPMAPRVVVHVHELEFNFRTVAGPRAIQRILGLGDRFIACCGAVAENLVKAHELPLELVDVVHEFIPTRPSLVAAAEVDRRQLRERLCIAGDALVVGACGEPGWRKGSDLFAQLAARVASKSSSPVHFVWIGGAPTSSGTQQLAHDVEHAGLRAFVTHLPTQPDPAPLFRGLDLFVLPSREDPYPLVCLEAAACGLPIVCFDRAGGMPEFVEDDCGVVIPYLQVYAMAEAVIRLLADPERRAELGRVGQRKVRERHDVAVAGPKILSSIELAITGQSTGTSLASGAIDAGGPAATARPGRTTQKPAVGKC